MNLTDKQRKILRAILLLSVILSVGIGIKALFIDLYEPGSLYARQLNSYVNWIFIGSILLSIPLILEKIERYKEWNNKFSKATDGEQLKLLSVALTPIIKKIGIILLLTIIASVLISAYWQIPPEVIANYQQYYTPKRIGLPTDFNITINNTP